MTTVQSQINRLEALKEKHRQLDKDLKVAQKSFADDATVADIKKQKLSVKDSMARLRKQLETV